MLDRRVFSTVWASADERAEDAALSRADAVEDALVKAAGVVLFTLFTAAGAQISIPTPPYGIPVSLQTLAAVCAALYLGPKLGTVSMLLYIVLGAVGMPLFADGESGVGVTLGQTGGSILGFMLCQPVICSIVRRRNGSIRGWGAVGLAALAGHAVVFAIGVPWLYLSRRYWLDDGAMSVGTAVHYGLVVFLPGTIIKSAMAVFIAWTINPWVSRRFW